MCRVAHTGKYATARETDQAFRDRHQLPAYQAMRLGIANLENEERASKKDDD